MAELNKSVKGLKKAVVTAAKKTKRPRIKNQKEKKNVKDLVARAFSCNNCHFIEVRKGGK